MELEFEASLDYRGGPYLKLKIEILRARHDRTHAQKPKVGRSL